MKKLFISFIITLIGLSVYALVRPIQPVHATGTNLIANADVETNSNNQPTNWSQGNWGTNSATFTYNSTGYQSGHSLSISMTSYTSGDAKWYFDPVSVSPSTKYAFTDYSQSNVTTYIVAQEQDSGGNLSYTSMATVTASSAWQQNNTTITTKSTTTKLTVFHYIAAIGQLSTDNFSLSPYTPSAVQLVNGVPNGNLEQVSDLNTTMPAAWNQGNWGTNTAKFNYLNTGHTGSHSVQVSVSNYSSGDAKWYYDSQPATPNMPYKVSDWYKATVPTTMYAVVTSTSNVTSYILLGQLAAANVWTQANFNFTAPTDAARVTIYHLIAKNGSLTTDDYSLTANPLVGFNQPMISLTFDDGWASQYTTGLPVLQQYNFKSTFYIISGAINDTTDGYMTSAMVKNLDQTGNEIGSHTVNHPDLTTLSATKLNNELVNSQQTLQALLGHPVLNFATPYGAYNAKVTAAIAQHYSSNRNTDTGFNGASNFDRYNLLVQNIEKTTTNTEVQSWVNQAKQTNTWLILVYHQVDNIAANIYGVTPSNFQAQMELVANSGIIPVTIQQGLAKVQP